MPETVVTENQGRLDELFRVGAHFGYSKSRVHPSTKPFIFGFKNRMAIINLEETLVALERAKSFVRGLGLTGAVWLLVGNKEEARPVIKTTAAGLGLPYVASRWLGGTITNWVNIKSRIVLFNNLKNKQAAGDFVGLSKKERARWEKEIGRLEKHLVGLAELTQPPAALLVVDPDEERIAVTEAGKKNIPVVAIAGSDCNLAGVTYPIVANDANVAAIRFLVGELAAAYQAGVGDRLATPVTAPAPVSDPAVL